MNFVILKNKLGIKFMCKNDFFLNLRTKKRTFQNLETKTIITNIFTSINFKHEYN